MSKVECSINEGKKCNEAFCQYLYHQKYAQYWLEMWKIDIEKSLKEYNKKIKGNDK